MSKNALERQVLQVKHKSEPLALSAQKLHSWLTAVQTFLFALMPMHRSRPSSPKHSWEVCWVLRWSSHVCSTLEGELQRERVDRWCLDVAKSGLQERVAAQAAAVVELEGLTEKLSLQCSDKAQTVQVDFSSTPH